MKVLVDTNVILDFFLSREPHVAEAKQLFEMICKEEIAAFTTASSITDIYYITAKRLGNDPAREAVRQLLKILSIIAVDGNDCTHALDFPLSDYEDALVTVCAKKEDIDYIVSNDKEFSLVDPKLARVLSSYDFINRYSG